jgi:hypothetical protein
MGSKMEIVRSVKDVKGFDTLSALPPKLGTLQLTLPPSLSFASS